MVDHFEQWKEFFYVQEFIDGAILKEEIKARLPEAKVRVIVTDILEILDFVHSRGVVHRDVKPENIIRRKKDNKLVLIDFGAVKELDKLLNINARQNIASSLVIGTRGYMSAEQANGHPCYASDIYAVGMIGIQCLTGRHPQNIPLDDKLQPKWRDQAIVSSKFASILDCMASYRPAERYTNAGEALKTMQALQLLGTSEWLQEATKLPISGTSSQLIVKEEKRKLATDILIKETSTVNIRTKITNEPWTISVSYEGLEKLLKVSDWRGADEMTTKLILKLSDCEPHGSLEMLDIEKLTTESLKKIDNMWTEYSNGHFGFSIQKQFWQKCGSPDDYNKNWEKFADTMG
jgi:serine/threonine-protein kinase